jgi:hypothetical protein
VTATLLPTRPQTTAAAPARARAFGDRHAALLLGLLFALVVAVTWRKWGAPEADAGSELATADLVGHGTVPYEGVRYYYGPLGLYGLVLAFKLTGASFGTAFGFGLLQAAGIVGALYALARQWVAPLTAMLAGAVVMAIGFSGTAFNYVLPHTNSATVGILCILLALLALARGRLVLTGVFVGLVGLTRPEYEVVAVAASAAAVIGTWRATGRRDALSAAWRLALPAVAIPVVVLGGLAAWVGVRPLLTEGIVPVNFISGGLKTQGDWMPLTAASGVALVLRALVYVGALAALAAAAERWADRGRRRTAALPPLAFLAAALAVDAALRASGALEVERTAIEEECRHLILGMSWLPALGLAAVLWAALRLRRGGPAPLGRSWAADLALVAAAGALGLRAYNAFTAEASYAPYYAAPLVLLLAILHQRIADRRPAARPVLIGALGAVAAGLATFAIHGLYADQQVAVHTPRGTFVTTAAGARAIGGAVEAVRSSTRPGEPIVAAPAVGGLYFMADRPPALREVMLLPGLLEGRAGELDAIRRLRAVHVRVAAIAERDFRSWGTPRFGRDFYPLLGAELRRETVRRRVVGTLADPQGGTTPSHGYTILTLR